MSLTSFIRPARKSPRPQPRHQRDDTALDIPVPAAQVQAQRESGPQPVLPAGTHPYPLAFESPVPPEAPMYAGNPQRRVTEAYTPDFARAADLPRRYAPPNTQPVAAPPPPPEKTPVGDALNAGWQWAHEVSDEARSARQRARSLNYPRHDLNASGRDYRALFARADQITGTRGTADSHPRQALTAADERWGAAITALQEAEEALRDASPEKAAAHARLREAVEAAPDAETALRLARNAADAGITGYVRLYAVEYGDVGVTA